MPLIAICDHCDNKIPSTWEATVEMRFGKGRQTKVYLCEICQFGVLSTMENLLGHKFFDVIAEKWSLEEVARLELATEDWPTVASWPDSGETSSREALFGTQLRGAWVMLNGNEYKAGTQVEVLSPGTASSWPEVRFPGGDVCEVPPDRLEWPVPK